MSPPEHDNASESRPVDESSGDPGAIGSDEQKVDVADVPQDSPKPPGSPSIVESSLPSEQPGDAEPDTFRPRGRAAHPSAGVKTQPVRR
ncbi:hypothetical protein CERSUDRAFT_85424 [Gelatoporia subvermispora B]|uniref:Uncharacterized protein n=1 Tax=Ceriporiopsis subvermispora (strain B) TaxID=914234 RepID=M2R9M6_CERS8|nr:hypothetical protein CERSUDRAFT_85424 [Gelatoporia subvermispora B]